MNHHLVSFLVFVAAAPTDPSPIRLPVVQQQAAPPQPMPADAAITLSPDVLYVVEADVPCLTFLSPGGAVRFTKEAGPLTVRGKFVGGVGSETKKFTGKHVYLFEAVREGRDELIIVPVGAVDEMAARRVTFQVGKAPQPPPDVKPDPKPDDPKPVTSFRVIMVKESGKSLTSAQSSVFAGKQVEDYLIQNTTVENGMAGFRRYDPQQGNEDTHPGMSNLWSSVKPSITTVPCWVVEVNGKAEIIPFPANVADAMSTLAKYKGGK